MNVKVQDAAVLFFLQEAEMSATCWVYGRIDPHPSISPIIRIDGVYSLFANDCHEKRMRSRFLAFERDFLSMITTKIGG